MTSSRSLSQADFGALAAGDPDARVVGKLLTGLLGKRMLMLRAILDLAEERCPAAYPALDSAYGLLAQAESRDRAATQTVLTHPSVGAWASRSLRQLQQSADSPGRLADEAAHLAAVAAAAAIRAQHRFTIEVPVRDGVVMLPTLGLATFAGMDVRAVTVASDGNGVTIAAGDQVVAIPPDSAEDAEGWLGLRRLRSQAGEATIGLDLDDIDPARYSDGNALSSRLDGPALGTWQAMLDGAWEILTAHYPRRAKALAVGLRCIVPLRRRAHGAGSSVTLADAFGGISMTAPANAQRFADTLIHEFHHSLLYAVAAFVSLHNAGPRAEHYSPWRDDPRPVEGVLHGAYAYLGVVEFWRGQRHTLTGPDLRCADFEFARWRREVAEAAESLLSSGTLTVPGTAFVQGMAATATRWLGQPVDEEAQRLADRMAADHRLRWRLRVRRPDPVVVAALTEAWLAGQPCPEDPRTVPVTIGPQPRRLILSDRARLYSQRLRNPDAIDRCQASAADLAYTRDDFARALELYQAAIADDPRDTEAWAGLALTLMAADSAGGLASAPEVARAVYLEAASRATAPDVTALDLWLAQPAAGAAQAAAAVAPG